VNNKLTGGQRDRSLDILSGIFIIYMIISHILQMNNLTGTSLYTISTRILFPFMAFFFWKSGWFYKDIKVQVLVKKDFRKLLKPYLVWVLISFFYETTIGLYHQTLFLNWKYFIKDIILIESPSSNAALWFLPTLLLCQIIFRITKRYMEALIICLLSFVIAWGINIKGICYPIWIGNVPYALTFYSLGHLMKTKELKNIISIAVVFAIIYIIFPNYVGARDNVFVYGNCYPLAITCSMAFIVLYYSILRKLNIHQNLLSFIGRNSMALYISHYIFLVICTKLLSIGNYV
jgi:fucose 4-O-acetylase-like acetyltransferase